jgi:hypothetical protein
MFGYLKAITNRALALIQSADHPIGTCLESEVSKTKPRRYTAIKAEYYLKCDCGQALSFNILDYPTLKISEVVISCSACGTKYQGINAWSIPYSGIYRIDFEKVVELGRTQKMS